MSSYTYFVIFYGVDGEQEEYGYNTEAEAREQLDLFRDDDSGLYAGIDLIRYEWATGKEEPLEEISCNYA